MQKYSALLHSHAQDRQALETEAQFAAVRSERLGFQAFATNLHDKLILLRGVYIYIYIYICTPAVEFKGEISTDQLNSEHCLKSGAVIFALNSACCCLGSCVNLQEQWQRKLPKAIENSLQNNMSLSFVMLLEGSGGCLETS